MTEPSGCTYIRVPSQIDETWDSVCSKIEVDRLLGKNEYQRSKGKETENQIDKVFKMIV